MQLAMWTYEGPPHVGAMRVATAMRDVHYVLHAPQGDTYADLLFTMIERRGARPPVTYTTFEARDLGSDTAEIFKRTARAAYDRFRPAAMLVGASCTAELIQDDPGGLAKTLGLPVPIVALELPSYQRKEHWGASETFYQLTRALADRARPRLSAETGRPSCNILGPTALGFRCRDDVAEIAALLARLGIDVHAVAPFGASAADIAAFGAADFNVVLYPEIAETTARWLEKELGQPYTKTIPLGVGATREFVVEAAALAGVDPAPGLERPGNLGWWSRSIDSTYLTGKRVFIFGEANRAAAAARVAAEELAFEVVCVGGYNREFARATRASAAKYGAEALIADDYLEIEAKIAELRPELVLGTQMERHIAKRLGIPCAVISAPAHVQDYPARYSPQLGFEGANVLFDSWIHPLAMGLEEHLLHMFRDDFEFNDAAGPSHLHGAGPRPPPDQSAAHEAGPAPDLAPALAADAAAPASAAPGVAWSPEAERELKKIPFFVRGKARRNAELFAAGAGLSMISVETLYDAKAHYAR